MDLTSLTSPNAALHEPPPLRVGRHGRPRKKGARLPTLQEEATDSSSWTTMTFDSQGLYARLRWKHREALCYAVTGSRQISVILM
jgi:hypothetical protein